MRRTFTAAYKLRIVEEYFSLTEHGARGALLRREGLYQSQRSAHDAKAERVELAAPGELTNRSWDFERYTQ